MTSTLALIGALLWLTMTWASAQDKSGAGNALIAAPSPASTEQRLAEEIEKRREAEHRAAIAEAKAELTAAATSRLEVWIAIYGIIIAVIGIIGAFLTRSQALKAKEKAERAANVAGIEAAKAARLEMLNFRADAETIMNEIRARRGEADEMTEFIRTRLGEMAQKSPGQADLSTLTTEDKAELSREVSELAGKPRASWSATDYKIRLLGAFANNDWGEYSALGAEMAKGFADSPDDLAFALFAVGIGRSKAGDHVGAASAYADYLARCPNDVAADRAGALSNWGIALAGQAQAIAGAEPAEANRLWGQAGEKYAAAIAIKADDHEALNNWGNALADQAKAITGADPAKANRLWGQAGEKFAAAIAIKPDGHGTLNNWGAALANQAQVKEGRARSALLNQAEEKLMLAQELKSGASSYNLACVAGLRANAAEAAKWLRHAKDHNSAMPDCAHIAADTDFDAVRDTPEFQQALIAIGCAPAA